MGAHFRAQAAACGRLGSAMYAALLGRLADDIEAGGVAAEVLAGHEDDPGPSALALRLVGSVHRLVLDGRAPELAPYYPDVGGEWLLDEAWPVFLAVLRDHAGEIRGLLEHPPQTNEVGRAGALMGGLLRVGEQQRLPVRLFEFGSSAGLNLYADRFHYTTAATPAGEAAGGLSHGPPDSPVRLTGAWTGAPLQPWPELEVVERLGSDVRPVDPTRPEGRLMLTAYVWPDQQQRQARLRAALDLAARHVVPVRRQDAASFVAGIGLHQHTTTVLWHSVVWQYLPADQQDSVAASIERLGDRATSTAPFAHLFLEPTRRTAGSDHEFLVVLRLWPDGRRRILGSSAAHGIPVTWE